MTGKIRQSIGRQYAPAELAGLFFAFSVAGWLWEVALHLVFNGELVKRGTMLGPDVYKRQPVMRTARKNGNGRTFVRPFPQ